MCEGVAVRRPLYRLQTALHIRRVLHHPPAPTGRATPPLGRRGRCSLLRHRALARPLNAHASECWRLDRRATSSTASAFSSRLTATEP